MYLPSNGDGLVNLGGRVGVTSGDPLVTGSANYTIRDVIDDGTGMARLMLEIN